MEQFRAVLQACDPARGIFRAYRIEAGTDLLGDWLVDVTYGRIGTPGRRIRHIAASEADARKIVRYCLQRRRTAPKRIGVPYQLRELSGPAEWAVGIPGPAACRSGSLSDIVGETRPGELEPRDVPMRANKNTLSDEEVASVAATAKDYILVNHSISNRELRKLTGINYDQAIWFFNRMVEQGVLMRVGISSSTKYLLSTQQQPDT